MSEESTVDFDRFGTIQSYAYPLPINTKLFQTFAEGNGWYQCTLTGEEGIEYSITAGNYSGEGTLAGELCGAKGSVVKCSYSNSASYSDIAFKMEGEGRASMLNMASLKLNTTHYLCNLA